MNQRYEKYSVLISVYCKEQKEFLQASLESMINQTLIPDQIVLIEDGELTQELESLIKHYEERYPKIFDVVRRKENKGLGYSLNEGLKLCRNNLVARMDSDDISLKNRCELQMKRFNEEQKLIILGGQINEFVDSPDNIISQRTVPCKYDDIYKFSHRRSPFNHPTVMYKRDEILKLGGYPEVKRKEDLKLFLDAIFNGLYCENLEETVLLYRTSIDNMKRRTTFVNCKEYIQIMYNYLQLKNISLSDFIYILMGQLSLYILPTKICKVLSNIFLRKNISKDGGIL